MKTSNSTVAPGKAESRANVPPPPPRTAGPSAADEPPAAPKFAFLGVALLLAIILVVLFRHSFSPGMVLFSNDSPLGMMVTECSSMPTSVTGVWVDLNWLGNEGVGPSPSVTGILRYLTSPWFYAKFYPPVTLFLLGLCAWFCFRKMKLAPVACLLGALAAALNSDFFSTACWGVESQMVAVGMNYLALGFLVGLTEKRRWLGVILAGLAVGMNIMEAYDIGALFSLFVAAFVVYQSLFLNGDVPIGGRLGKSVMRTAGVAICAGLIAAYTLSTLIGTQIKGVAGMGQDYASKQRRWLDATVWSLPKAEAFQVAVPGLFGYRMYWPLYDAAQPGDDEYWGTVGAAPPGWWRFSGTGYYAGVPVVLIALWTVVQSLRKKGSVFPLMQRRMIWFWSGVTLLSLLMAFGKYAPFYQLFYALPYASTIRNPTKFMHIFSWALMIIFAYGVHGLYMTYLRNPVAQSGGAFAQFKAWKVTASAFDRRWMLGCFIAVGAALLGLAIYASGSSNLQSYMQKVGIEAAKAPKMAAYSIMAVGWFMIFLALSVVTLALIFSGFFAGPRARWGAVLLGVLIAVDLGRAAVPWISYWDANYKYVNSPIVNILADKPYEHRVSLFPFASQTDAFGQQQMAVLQNTYQLDWKQALFLYDNIQSLDVVQEPRVTVEKDAFLHAIPPMGGPDRFKQVMRHWELTNTRYLIGQAAIVEPINEQLDPEQKRFHILKSFDFVQRSKEFSPLPVDYTTEIRTNGRLALVEFTGALPRAKLFANWKVVTNDTETLQTLASESFDPHKTVLVAEGVPNSDAANATNDAGTVEIKPNYRSKRIEMEADAKTPAVLLLCDRYNPKWQVTVDGKPAELLRCNYIERGVLLPPGKHTVVFQFTTSLTTLGFSSAVLAVGLLLWGYVTFIGGKPKRNS